jgi:hypothetical protein
MRTTRALCAYLIIALGVVHVALTGRATGGWASPRALFFLGAGLAILLLAAVNLIMNRAGDDPVVRGIGVAANCLGVALFSLGGFALPQPQVFALLVLMLVVWLLSIVPPRDLVRRATWKDRAGRAKSRTPRARRAIGKISIRCHEPAPRSPRLPLLAPWRRRESSR